MNKPWTQAEAEILRGWYTSRTGKVIDLNEIARILGRSRASVACKVNEIGLGDRARPLVEQRKPTRKYPTDEESRKAISESTKKRLSENGHPRGFQGRTHTEDAKRKIAETSAQMWERITDEQREAMVAKRRGTIASRGPVRQNGSEQKRESTYSRCRRGKRADLGEQFFRSSWEANYARFLNWMIGLGQVREWQYEPTTFYFEGVKRGAISYTPDFRVVDRDGVETYREIKGWLTSKDRTRFRRMSKHHPGVNLVLIDEHSYRSLESSISRFIENWEFPEGQRKRNP